jgi:hypothetical protein
MERSEIIQKIKALVMQAFKSIQEKPKDISEERCMQIIEHIDKSLKEFGNDFKKIALYHDHPYIGVYLNSALVELKEEIKS